MNQTYRIGLVLLSLQLSSSAFAAQSPQAYTSVQQGKEHQIEAIRNEEIRAVKTALSLRSPENRKAELYLRLAELYLEAYRADFLLEGRLHEKALQTKPDARLERGRSLDDLKYGIGSAEQILPLKVDRTKLDQVYYFLGYNYGELGNTKKSNEYYKRLVKEFPNSQYAVVGLRATADEAFQKGDYTEARALYEQALTKTKDPSQQARIYHKLAWCYYRQKRTNDAIDSMKKAISISQGDQEKFLNIREEGLRDLAVYYAESGRVDEAIAYFQKNAGGVDKLAVVLEKLGKEYERTGQTEKAQQVYDVLLKLNQKDESSFRVATKLIDLDLIRSQFDSAYRRILALQIPKSDDADTRIAIINLRKSVRTTGVNNHERFRNADDKKEARRYLMVADQFYSIYLAKFLPQDEASKVERNEVRMYLAEVKRDLGQPGDAAHLYKLVIEDKDPKYSNEAARLWVGSLAAELKLKAANGEKAGATPSALEQDFVGASDLLERSIPDSTESREARLRSAQILAAYPSEKQNAIVRASKLAKEAPNSPQGVLAARLWLQLVPEKSTLDQIKSSQALLATDQGQKKALAKDIEATSTKLKVGEIASLEKNKNYLEAAKGYEEFARSAKTEKEAETPYIGAINAYAQNGSSDEVARTMREWKAKYPKSAVIEKTVKDQASQFFIRGLFNESAELFLGIGRQFKDVTSYMTSAALFDGGLQRQKARDVYKMSLALAPKDEEKANIHRLSALVANDMKDDLSALNDWKSCYSLNSSLKAECGSQIGNYYLRLSDTKQAKAIFEQVVRIKKGPSNRSNYIAYAQFRLAQLLEKEMKNLPLKGSDDELIKTLTLRAGALAPVTTAYEKAIAFEGPWGIAASERFGDLNLDLASDLEKLVREGAISKTTAQTFSAVAAKARSAAGERSKSAYAYAVKSQQLSPALPVIQDRLVDGGIGGMNRAQGERLGVKLIGISADGGKGGSAPALQEVREKLLKNQEDALSWIDYGNLLWGTGKPGLSKVAYQRSLDLKTRRSDALNNLAVVLVSDQGFENWSASNEAIVAWKKALSYESTNSAALFNLGHYFNYFRLFEPALVYFEKAERKVNIGEVHDGIAVASYGLGRKAEATMEFKKAEELGQNPKRFAKAYVTAAQALVAGSKDDCRDALDSVSNKDMKGFEKISADLLKARCQK
jgi:tetratricopeptide (TPR) repeat protein